jgi:hypothetical protein
MNKSPVNKAYEYIPSEQGEREGEAPSGFDRLALGGLQPMCGGGDVNPLKKRFPR